MVQVLTFITLKVFKMKRGIMVLHLAFLLGYLSAQVSAQGVRTESLGYRSVPDSYTAESRGPKQPCPQNLMVEHRTSDGVSPVDVAIAYDVVGTDITGSRKCWITRNLGATQKAARAVGGEPETYGWFWQFNQLQGYTYDNIHSSFIPSSGWSSSIAERSDWTLKLDPCRKAMGGTWRLPTQAEWEAASSIGDLFSIQSAYASAIQLYALPYVYFETGMIKFSSPDCLSLWSSSTAKLHFSRDGAYGYSIGVDPTTFMADDYNKKTQGLPVRCLMDL